MVLLSTFIFVEPDKSTGVLTMMTAIRRSRDGAWGAVIKRRHVIVKIYSSQPNASDDLLVLGNNTIDGRNGNSVQFDFVAHIGLEGPNSSDPRIKSCETWAVSKASNRNLEDITLLSRFTQDSTAVKQVLQS